MRNIFFQRRKAVVPPHPRPQRHTLTPLKALCVVEALTGHMGMVPQRAGISDIERHSVVLEKLQMLRVVARTRAFLSQRIPGPSSQPHGVTTGGVQWTVDVV